MILTSDIGGTKTYLALMKIIADKLILVKFDKLATRDIHSIEETILTFIRTSLPPEEKIESACFSLAGTIKDNVCYLVNLNLSVDLAGIRKALDFIPSIEFCNDMEALASGLPVLSSDNFLSLAAGQKDQACKNENKAVIAPGTGLGQAYLLKGKYPFPTEGGHTEFGPQSEEELNLWHFLNNRFGHVSYERILSGQGLQNIYDFLTENKGITCKNNLLPEEITQNALVQACPYCMHTLDIFVSVLGAEAGNLALNILAYGGVYLGGGIVPQIIPWLKKPIFLNSFYNKGRLSPLMEKIPLYAIMTDKAALYGSALIACQKADITISCVNQL